MGYRLNCLDEPVFMAVPKPMLTEFGIHHRLESCAVPGTAKDMDRQLPIFSFFGWPLFVKGSCVAKVLSIYGTTRCQKKIWTLSFHRYLVTHFGPSGLDTVNP